MKSTVFVAGTFDGIHKGHEALLHRAFDEGKAVLIGLTSNEFVKKFKKHSVRSYSVRHLELQDWLSKHAFQAKIIPIVDFFEPAATLPDLVAIVASTETVFRADQINDLRKKRNLGVLKIFEVPILSAQDKKPISSTRVRSGEIDPTGRLIMPDSMRDELAMPLGIVLAQKRIKETLDNHKKSLIISVGDVTTETLVGLGVMPSLAIIDQKVNRKAQNTLSRLPKTLVLTKTHIASGPGYIAKEAMDFIRIWAKKPKTTLLVVDGEEDLLALPAISYAPVGSVVFYGQPAIMAWACGPEQEGLVEVIVTDEKRQEVKRLLKRFL